MVNGMADSPEMVRVMGLSSSSATLPLVIGGFDMVGDGTISASRGGGSLRDSVFQIPVPHGNVLPLVWPQELELAKLGLVLAAQVWSAAVVAGIGAAEEKEVVPVVNEAFLGSPEGTSFNHEVRRAGFDRGPEDMD